MQGDGAKLGQTGEEIARRYLQSRGYWIVERNWRCRFGELDLIARDGDTLVFVEVKARTRDGFGGPEGAVTPRKRARMVAAARAYMREVGTDLAVRFDVVAVRPGKVTLYRDAFQVEDVL